jgi:signal transduction histidine kinase
VPSEPTRLSRPPTLGQVFAPREALPGSAALNRRSGWAGLAAFMAFLFVGLATRISDRPADVVTGMVIAVAAGAPLFLIRPRFVLAYAAAATVGVVLVNATPGDIGWFALPVLGIWCVLSGGIRLGLVYLVGSVAVLGVEWLSADGAQGWGNWIAGTVLSVLAAALVRHELVLVERLRAAQRGLAERSRAEERNRIARELHDVIAHSLTVSLLHVSSARLAVEHDPADAARSLAEAERLGRESLDEVRATMGLLRARSGEAIAPPVPEAGDVARLVEQFRGAGADVSLVTEGKIVSLPATVGSTVYRILQEALTNAAKHAAGSTVLIRVVLERKRVDVQIFSRGEPGTGTGFGLSSMKERAEAVGGTCTAGRSGQGWLVHASLPVRPGQGQDPS